jgi:hypothetical protein
MQSNHEILERLTSSSVRLFQNLRDYIAKHPLDEMGLSTISMIDQHMIDLYDIGSIRYKLVIAPAKPNTVGQASNNIQPSQPNQVGIQNIPYEASHQMNATESILSGKIPKPAKDERNPQPNQVKKNNSKQDTPLQITLKEPRYIPSGKIPITKPNEDRYLHLRIRKTEPDGRGSDYWSSSLTEREFNDFINSRWYLTYY